MDRQSIHDWNITPAMVLGNTESDHNFVTNNGLLPRGEWATTLHVPTTLSPAMADFRQGMVNFPSMEGERPFSPTPASVLRRAPCEQNISIFPSKTHRGFLEEGMGVKGTNREVWFPRKVGAAIPRHPRARVLESARVKGQTRHTSPTSRPPPCPSQKAST